MSDSIKESTKTCIRAWFYIILALQHLEKSDTQVPSCKYNCRIRKICEHMCIHSQIFNMCASISCILHTAILCNARTISIQNRSNYIYMISALTFLGAFSFNGLQMCDVGAKTPD